jgi:hypothetical protein
MSIQSSKIRGVRMPSRSEKLHTIIQMANSLGSTEESLLLRIGSGSGIDVRFTFGADGTCVLFISVYAFVSTPTIITQLNQKNGKRTRELGDTRDILGSAKEG